MSTEATPIDDASAEDLIAFYDATGDVLEQSAKKKAVGMMIDECQLRICERTEGKPSAS